MAAGKGPFRFVAATGMLQMMFKNADILLASEADNLQARIKSAGSTNTRIFECGLRSGVVLLSEREDNNIASVGGLSHEGNVIEGKLLSTTGDIRQN